ncbi:MAG TPA: DNA polymerase III subunit delta' [Candidatus Megaira endosymbiont of Nemacystus decipiens]|nr:DNA polymerase III subunit delta' [Candidatus Megaera endosymbiont of Nemacystus decipiens]
MLIKYLLKQNQIGRLHSSYIIKANDLDQALADIEIFAKEFLQTNNLRLCGDYHLVKKLDNKNKNISIGQIRNLQTALYQSSVVSGKKVAVIYGSDQMNLHASNSCLKLLEEAPQNTFIFLLTDNPLALISTIRSRCIKINHIHDNVVKPSINQNFVQVLLNSTPIEEKNKFIESFASKNQDLWKDISTSAELLIAKLCRYHAGVNRDKLLKDEQKLWKQLKTKQTLYLQKKYENIVNIIANTNNFDLDLRSSCLLLIQEFHS